jgi:hypothetical protein
LLRQTAHGFPANQADGAELSGREPALCNLVVGAPKLIIGWPASIEEAMLRAQTMPGTHCHTGRLERL